MTRASRPQRRAGRWLIGLLAVVVVLSALFWLLFDANWFKGMVERRVEHATGRAFAIDGDLRLHAGWPPRISASELRLANADWGEAPELLTVERIEVGVWPWRALRGRWHLPTLALQAPVLHLERNAEGAVNWDGLLGDDRNGDLRIDRLQLADGELRFVDAEHDSDLTVAFATATGEHDGPAPLLLQGDGRYRGEAFELQGAIGSPLLMDDADRPYAIDLSARAGATRARIRGGLLLQLPPESLDVEFRLSGDDLADVEPLFGLALPETPPYRLEGRLLFGEGRWRYTDFSGTIGDSDLSGQASIEVGDRLVLRADLHSNLLHIDDLAGVLGGAPDPDGTVSAAQRREAARRAALGKVFPDRDIPARPLRAADAEVSLEARQIQPRRWPLETMKVKVVARNGKVTVDPLHFTSAGGTIDAVVEIDAGADPIRYTASARGRGMEVPLLFPNAEFAKGAQGRIGGELELRGSGASVAKMMASATGSLKLLMGRGRLRGPGDGEGFDLAAAAGFVSDDDGWMRVRCGYADFAVEDGVARAQALAVDTARTLILGEGEVRLDQERWDLTLRPRPKQSRLPGLRTPVAVVGPLDKPEVDPKVGALVARGAAAALLYSLAPPAALLALVETGPGEDADCRELAAAAGSR
jgi:AsmA family protein